MFDALPVAGLRVLECGDTLPGGRLRVDPAPGSRPDTAATPAKLVVVTCRPGHHHHAGVVVGEDATTPASSAPVDLISAQLDDIVVGWCPGAAAPGPAGSRDPRRCRFRPVW